MLGCAAMLSRPDMFLKEDAFLKQEVFDLIAERVKDRRDSLLHIARFPRLGIEGWLKVEAVRALSDRVEKILNTGPDLQLADGVFIELKGATDCNPSYILGGLIFKTEPRYRRLACLFLGSGNSISTCMAKLELGSRVLAYERFSAGTHEWVVGLIVPRPASVQAERLTTYNSTGG